MTHDTHVRSRSEYADFELMLPSETIVFRKSMSIVLGVAARRFLVLIAPLALTGCTLGHSWIYRPTNYEALPQDDYKKPVNEPPLAALSVDASRRLVMTQTSPAAFIGQSGERVTCPEPPPDAGMSLAAKTVLGLTREASEGKKTTANVSDELTTTIVALANRSAEVEMMRTASSSYCTLLMNGWTSQANQYLIAVEHILLAKVSNGARATSSASQSSTPAKELALAQRAADAAELDRISAEQVKKIADELLAQAKRRADTKEIAGAQVNVDRLTLAFQRAEGAKQLADHKLGLAKRVVEEAKATAVTESNAGNPK